MRLSISVQVSKKIVEMVNKWGLQISIGGDSNINKQWDVYLALKSTFMMRGYGGSGKMRMLQQE